MDETKPDADPGPHIRRWIGLVSAPLLALCVYWWMPVTSDLAQPGRAVASVGVMMATLWVTEALPIPVTALLPIGLLPLLTRGSVTVRAAAAPYAHELIFLFMGGFLLAIAMQRWRLHRRIALHTILLVGTRPAALVGGFMAASAFLSMWVSNTATVVMMLPIAISVIELVRRELQDTEWAHVAASGRPFHFAICLLLGTAYASSIGGIGTLIGTPPNALLAAFLSEQYGLEISFVRWMAVGLPLVIVFVPVAWLVLTRFVFRIRLPSLPGGRALIERELRSQGAMSRGEWSVLIVFAMTAGAWITRPLLMRIALPDGTTPLAGLSDAGIAIAAAVLLFAIPVDARRGVFLLNWKQARELPWGILILFGGGLSLASALEHTGVAAYLAQGVHRLGGLPTVVLVLIVTAMIVFLTELTSNTATTATFLPILAAVAIGLDLPPQILCVPATIGASCAFMMPVATPPNAIVFSAEEISIPQMCKAGLWLNVIGIALIVALLYAVAQPVLGLNQIGLRG